MIIVLAQAPDIAEEDHDIYNGFEYGVAGIVDSLLDYYIIDQSIEPTITLALNALWNARYNNGTDQIAVWLKTDGSDIYPGIKYGNAGIIKTFIKAYNILDEVKYLKYAVEAGYTLYSHSPNSSYPSWPYAYLDPALNKGGIRITDMRYGNIGIISAFLDIYEASNDSIFLDMAINSTRYLVLTANNYTINGNTFGVLSWYVDNAAIIEVTSLLQGNAGLFKILPRLYTHTNNSFWMDWNGFIADWFVQNQNNDGSWYYNINEGNITVNSYGLGMAGILYELSEMAEYKTTVNNGLRWLNNQFISNATHTILPEYEDERMGWTSLYRGIAGAIQTFIRLSENGFDIDEGIFDNSLNWLINGATTDFKFNGVEYIAIVPRSNYDGYIDLSYGDGISGILSVLLQLDRTERIDLVINNIVNLLVASQDSNGMWAKQLVSDKLNYYYIFLGILIPVVIILLILNKKSK